MQRDVAGRYEVTRTAGEAVRAFVPAPLPPIRPCNWKVRCRRCVFAECALEISTFRQRRWKSAQREEQSLRSSWRAPEPHRRVEAVKASAFRVSSSTRDIEQHQPHPQDLARPLALLHGIHQQDAPQSIPLLSPIHSELTEENTWDPLRARGPRAAGSAVCH